MVGVLNLVDRRNSDIGDGLEAMIPATSAGTELRLGFGHKGFKTWVWAKNKFVVGVLSVTVIERQNKDLAGYLRDRIPQHVSWGGDVSIGGISSIFILPLLTLRYQLLTSF